MLRHLGEERSVWHDRALAGLLASTAGWVNSVGFVVIGAFTSHVTGNVGRLADDLAGDRLSAAAFAAILISAFFVGAFFASTAIEATEDEKRPRTYGLILGAEMIFLIAFMALAELHVATGPRGRDALAALLCASMGAQNSLVTRLSGAVIRTTHLTGALTDLGIEAARWFRYWRISVGERRNVRLTLTKVVKTKPDVRKAVLLLIIFASFIAGSAGGASFAVWIGHLGLIPAVALLGVTVFFGVRGFSAEARERP